MDYRAYKDARIYFREWTTESLYEVLARNMYDWANEAAFDELMCRLFEKRRANLVE